MSGWFVARIHGQGPAEQINVYNLETAVAPHVYNNDRRYAVLVVDMLHDFVYGKIKCDRAVPMIPRSGELIDSARGAGVPVLYSNDSFTELQYLTGLQYLKFWYLADTLTTKKISKLF